MNWYFKDSNGISGPLTEAQLRKVLAGKFEDTAMVRCEKSNWVAAQVARARFIQLEKDGVHLKSGDQTFGPFVASKADELTLQNPQRFDAKRIGQNGIWCEVHAEAKFDSEPIENHEVPPSSTLQIPQPPPIQNLNNPPIAGATTSNSGSNQFMLVTSTLSVRPRPRSKKSTNSQRNCLLSGCGCVIFPIAAVLVFLVSAHLLHPEVLAEVNAERKARNYTEQKEGLYMPIRFLDNGTKMLKVDDGYEFYLDWYYKNKDGSVNFALTAQLRKFKIVCVDRNGNCTEKPYSRDWEESWSKTQRTMKKK